MVKDCQIKVHTAYWYIQSSQNKMETQKKMFFHAFYAVENSILNNFQNSKLFQVL
jgi:hypothetical protein